MVLVVSQVVQPHCQEGNEKAGNATWKNKQENKHYLFPVGNINQPQMGARPRLPLCYRLVHISFHRSLSLGTSFCRTSCARCLVKQPNTTTWVKQTGCVGGFDMQPKWNKCFNVLGSNWRKQMTGPCSVIPCHSSASILREGLASTTGIVWATILKNVRRLFCFWSALMLTHAGPRVVCGGFSNQSKCQRVQNTSSKARKLQEDPRLFTTRACSGDSIWHSLNKVSFLNALR